MNITSAALFLGFIAALVVTVWGLYTKQRSAVIGVIAAAVAVLAFLGARYAWSESHSIPWTIGYGIVVLGALASAVRQFVGGRSTKN